MGGQKQKGGKAGNAVQYMTRNQALKKLQISLPAFRKLCILKGIYPRDPKRKVKGHNKTYYLTKDILFLLHDPLMSSMRERTALRKKVKRAKGTHEPAKAQRLQDQWSGYSLDHLVRERYPTFADALRDLDDCLSTLHLLASLPSTDRIREQRVQEAIRLCREWQLYVASSRSLRKVFISVKGVYYQAEVQGETITWLEPHHFTQRMPKNVDYRVILSFAEFYQTLLGFVNYRLYATIGLDYPPDVDEKVDMQGGFLAALQARKRSTNSSGGSGGASGNGADGGNGDDGDDNGDDNDDVYANAADFERLAGDAAKASGASNSGRGGGGGDDDGSDMDSDDAAADAMAPGVGEAGDDGEGTLDETRLMIRAQQQQERVKRLFDGLHFFIGREVPRSKLEFVIRAFGGRVSWPIEEDAKGNVDRPAGMLAEDDEQITHQIVDRPKLQGRMRETRDYVQPQWVFDSINMGVLLPCHEYAPGAVLPPHLSPFVDNEREGYVPERAEQLEKLRRQLESMQERGGAAGAYYDDDDDSEFDSEDDDSEFDSEEDEDNSDGGDDAGPARKKKRRTSGGKKGKKMSAAALANSNPAADYEQGLQQEMAGVAYGGGGASSGAAAGGKVRRVRAAPDEETEDAEMDAKAKQLAASLMPRKQRRRLKQFEKHVERKGKAIKKLETRRRQAEAHAAGQKKKSTSGKKKS